MRIDEIAQQLGPKWLARYDQYQLALLNVMRKNHIWPWALVGHWMFGKKISGIGRLKMPEMPQDVLEMVKKSYQLDRSGIVQGQLGHRYGLLCSGLMWVVLFPKEFTQLPLIEECRKANFNQVDERTAQIWAEEHLTNQKGIYPILFSLQARDAVRLASGES